MVAPEAEQSSGNLSGILPSVRQSLSLAVSGLIVERKDEMKAYRGFWVAVIAVLSCTLSAGVFAAASPASVGTVVDRT